MTLLSFSPDMDLSSKTLKNFYKELLVELNVPNARPTIRPYAKSGGNFLCVANTAGETHFYQDVGNYSAGIISVAQLATYQLRSVYHGRLELINYVYGLAGAPVFRTRNLLAARSASGGYGSWEYKRRSGLTNNDVTWNAYQGTGGLLTGQQQLGFVDVFDTIHSLLHTAIDITTWAPGDSVTVMTEWKFIGVRIDWT